MEISNIRVQFPDLLPSLSQEEFEALKSDIQKRGIMVPIEIDADTGKVLDGYHRLKACQELGIEKNIPANNRHFKSDNERKEHALKLNILRRQMDELTWAEAYKTLADLRNIQLGRGGDRKSMANLAVDTVEALSKELGVTPRTARRRLQNAEELKDHPEMKEKVKEGELSLSQAVLKVRNQKANKILEQKISIPPPKGKWRTIVIDPPWPIEKINREVRPHQVGMDYPTMTLEEIEALPIGELVDPGGCHVYLWFTQKYRRTAFELFDSWGVRDECFLTWVKNVGFTPFSWMYSTEHILFGRVGNLPLLKNGIRLDFSAKVREHSRKPEEFFEIVRQVSPETRLDMFGRENRNGFTVWGNETNRFVAKR